MNRFDTFLTYARASVPHRRGDEPFSWDAFNQAGNRSPQAWG